MLTPFQTARQFLWPQALGIRPADEILIADVQQRAREMRGHSDHQLRSNVAELKHLVSGGASTTDQRVLVGIFAAVADAARRAIGIELYDVQLLAALALARGCIAEMQTGEGKTFAAMPAAAAWALRGRGVHVVTPNAYLAARDHQQTRGVYELLGFTAGLVPEQGGQTEKRQAYACDITYATGYEIGFDYLRDQLARLCASDQQLGQRFRQILRGMAPNEPRLCQRGHAVAIIDEIDSVLLDEACLPLVLSDPAGARQQSDAVFRFALNVAADLTEGTDFLFDRTARSIQLTEAGLERVDLSRAEALQIGAVRAWHTYIQHALEATWLLERDAHYVIQDRKIRLVDGFTGRIFADRTWRDGLHQMVEAKENVPLTPEQTSSVSISRQRYFRLYETIAGMTGTASGSEREFWNMYRLSIVVVPTHRPNKRADLPTRFFADTTVKLRSIAEEVRQVHITGRPVLIGTRTIASSQQLAAQLGQMGVAFRLLNGTQDEDEARLIATAGQRGAVTLATNMAGRGTDIRLGDGVASLGGLHVIGVERQFSARIDRQLAGRAARQGDPGSARFFVAADDALVQDHAPLLGARMRDAVGPAGEISHDFGSEVSAAQRRAEAASYSQRRKLLAYDRWLDEVMDRLANHH